MCSQVLLTSNSRSSSSSSSSSSSIVSSFLNNYNNCNNSSIENDDHQNNRIHFIATTDNSFANMVAPASNPFTVSDSLQPSGVLHVVFSHSPVNALSTALQRAIADTVQRAQDNPQVKAIVLMAPISNEPPSKSSPRFFSSGADISEFAAFSSWSKQQFNDAFADNILFKILENGRKPVVALVDGVCFGGGFELALACSHRVATLNAAFALPELKLGIIPGLGGTQRLPRLAGFQQGVKAILHSSTISAKDAFAAGIVQALVTDPAQDPIQVASALAADIAQGRVQRIYPANFQKPNDPLFTDINSLNKCALEIQSKDVKFLSKNGQLPQYQAALDAALHGFINGSKAGLQREASLFYDLVTSPTSKALVHIFFATRRAGKSFSPSRAPSNSIPHPPLSTEKCIAVIGGGLMGAGIATVFLQANFDVIVKEINPETAQAAVDRITRNLASSPKKDSLLKKLSTTTQFEGFQRAALVIEAAVENVPVKQQIFKDLEDHTSQACILATNTSTINIDLIGIKTKYAKAQGRLVGAHFFSPAHKMPLLEIVRTESTSPAVVQALLNIGKAINKIPVVVGNCAGFAVNRMYFAQSQVATYLVENLAIDPYRIDKVSEQFGLPMGPFKLLDLVGIDIAVAIGEIYGMAYADRVHESDLSLRMVQEGRKGQKTGKGFYIYDKDSRKPSTDPDAIRSIIAPNQSPSIQHQLSDQDLLEMTLMPCVNEGCRILEEGVALSPADLDIASVYGMGFPSHKGGLIYWAENLCGGSTRVFERLSEFHKLTDLPIFKPSFALARAAAAATPIDRPPRPERLSGNPNDIVIVSARRTAVGRAGKGGFKDTSSDDLMCNVIEAILKDSKVDPKDIGDLVVGMVLPRGDSGVVQTRVAGILGGLPPETPVKTINRLCSSGLQAIADAANAIRNGDYDIAVAGGVESMSENAFSNTTLKLNPNAKKVAVATDCYLSMGQTSENVAQRYGISRERQDKLAVTSHARGSLAMLSGRQKNEIVPIKTKVTLKDKEGNVTTKDIYVENDEGVRVGVTKKNLGALKPVFKKDGTTTAGNSSQLSDGAAFVLLMKRSEAQKRSLKILGSFKEFAVAGVEPSVMGIGPAVAIPKVLKKAHLGTDDIDLYEVNEAFGSQADYCIETLDLNRDIVNVNGGAIAIGHPLGMTGARLTVSILHELHRRGGRYGIVSMCIGTGMGAAAIIEINSDYSQPKL